MKNNDDIIRLWIVQTYLRRLEEDKVVRGTDGMSSTIVCFIDDLNHLKKVLKVVKKKKK